MIGNTLDACTTNHIIASESVAQASMDINGCSRCTCMHVVNTVVYCACRYHSNGRVMAACSVCVLILFPW